MSAVITIRDPIGAYWRRPIPARMVLFTDQGSIGHVLFGALAGVSSEPWNLAITALFGGYEVSKLQSGESPARTGGKFVEFGLGLIGAGLIRCLTS